LKPEKDFIFSHTLFPIRLGEFDPGGVLYHARYFHLLEEIREAFLRSHHLPYFDLMQEGFHLPLISAEQKFIAPVRYGMEVHGRLAIESVTKVRCCLFYELTDKTNTLHLARTTLACVQEAGATLKPTPFPDTLLQILNSGTSHE
jgi:YbgC/YbaW family acyl-CoA thioester hydrolase